MPSLLENRRVVQGLLEVPQPVLQRPRAPVVAEVLLEGPLAEVLLEGPLAEGLREVPLAEVLLVEPQVVRLQVALLPERQLEPQELLLRRQVRSVPL